MFSSLIFRQDDDHLILAHVQSVAELPMFSMEEPMSLPTGEWSKHISEKIAKSNSILTHYEMLCEKEKINKYRETW